MARTRLRGLQPQIFQHPSDKAALDALSQNAALSRLIKKLHGWGLETMLRGELTGSYVRVTPNTVPEVHESLIEACEILDVEPPKLHIAGGGPNAFTVGVENPVIVLPSSVVDALTSDELLFVIAREVGHIKSGHVLYYQIAQCLPVISDIIGSAAFGIGDLFGRSIQVAILKWQRASELTADRAGLLGCQDRDLSMRTLMKLSGLPAKYHSQLNIADFVVQAREFQELEADNSPLVATSLGTMNSNHPWTVRRANQLLNWIDSGGYDEVFAGKSVLALSIDRCSRCGVRLKGSVSFCPACGWDLDGEAGKALRESKAKAAAQPAEISWRSEVKRKRSEEEFDVFLCHNSDDKPAVRQIAVRLQEHGLLPWLDESELMPGRDWQSELERQIGKIKSAAVFVGKDGVGPWQKQELRGLLDEFTRRHVPVIPVLLDTAPREWKLPIFLNTMTSVDFRVSEPDPMQRLIWGITGKRPND